MTTDHRAEALRLAEESRGVARPNDEGYCEADRVLAEALVHATLARDEEQATVSADTREALLSLRRRFGDMRSLVATHIAAGLASRDKDRWKAARELAGALDEAHCNVDDLVDARLEDDGWDPRSAYKAPASAARTDDPWAPAPDITGDIPEPVRRVLAGHLAEMLLDRDNEALGQAARGITNELKREGADLTDAIKTRINDLTLGRDPSDPPF